MEVHDHMIKTEMLDLPTAVALALKEHQTEVKRLIAIDLVQSIEKSGGNYAPS